MGMQSLVYLTNVDWSQNSKKAKNASKKSMRSTALLHEAVIRGDVASVKLLICHNVDVNATDERGSTPLHLAARFRCEGERCHRQH